MIIAILLSSFVTLVFTACNTNEISCQSRNVVLTDGTCSARSLSCDDGFACTTDTCNGGRCTYTPNATCAKCKIGCVANCTNRACGEDGCGGFCGNCPNGQGCIGGVCSSAAGGTCSSPKNLVNGTISTNMSFVVSDSTGDAAHILTPSCNFRSASPEIIYKFTIAEGKKMGYEFRSTGYDTVLELMKNICETKSSANCNDDATPPGDLGSSISGWATSGTYYLQIDGYSSADKGPFLLSVRFIDGCKPLCDGAFCGSDGCGFSCGTCANGTSCASNLRCYPNPCTPKCGLQYNRACGEDGCGGSCGSCPAGSGCINPKITPDAEDTANNITVPASMCQAFTVCDNMNPKCAPACGAKEFCASDCRCYAQDAKLIDFAPNASEMADQIFFQAVEFPSSSCVFVEKCVSGPGVRKLLRFTSTAVNQGQGEFSPPAPKSNPTDFVYGACHQHYHFKSFMSYELIGIQKGESVLLGSKSAYCLEDTRREIDGPGVSCDKKFDCANQGIQAGWSDSYGWSLDCSWLDVTNIPSGEYILRLIINPDRRLAEESYTNNDACVRVSIPADFTEIPVQKPGVVVACPVSKSVTSAGVTQYLHFAVVLAFALALL